MKDIPIRKIYISKTQLNVDLYNSLLASISTIGLIKPIRLRKYKTSFKGKTYQIVDGYHRVRVMKTLGVETIPAIIEEE